MWPIVNLIVSSSPFFMWLKPHKCVDDIFTKDFTNIKFSFSNTCICKISVAQRITEHKSHPLSFSSCEEMRKMLHFTFLF